MVEPASQEALPSTTQSPKQIVSDKNYSGRLLQEADSTTEVCLLKQDALVRNGIIDHNISHSNKVVSTINEDLNRFGQLCQPKRSDSCPYSERTQLILNYSDSSEYIDAIDDTHPRGIPENYISNTNDNAASTISNLINSPRTAPYASTVLFDETIEVKKEEYRSSDKDKHVILSQSAVTKEEIYATELPRQHRPSDTSADQLPDLNNPPDSQTTTIVDFFVDADKSADTSANNYQLRALNSDLSALHENPWLAQASALSQNIPVSTLSNELVNETLNYFVNCRQRLTQMTKTYDDNDAYLLLLQEKEVDLELAARIGQDLLKQNKHLKDLIQNRESELTKLQEDVQQLRHELASKTILLDTFIEEEDSTVVKQQAQASSIATPQQAKSTLPIPLDDLEDGPSNGFYSLNCTRPCTSSTEPFLSLPYHLVNSPTNESLTALTRDESSDTLAELVSSTSKKATENQKLFENITSQLIESNKRLSELQDELFHKGEQNLLQQEKIYSLQQQLKESDRRLDGVAAENESLRKSMSEVVEIRRELSEELKACRQNFSELFSVFLELQKESRINRTIQQNSNATFYPEIDPINDINNISFDSYTSTPFYNGNRNHQSIQAFQSNNMQTTHDDDRQDIKASNMSPEAGLSYSLHEELKDSMRKNGVLEDHSDNDVTDEADSGVHTQPTTNGNNIHRADEPIMLDSSRSPEDGRVSSSSSSTSHRGTNGASMCPDTDSEDSPQAEEELKRPWLDFTSFVLSTLVLLGLSLTLTSSGNSSFASRLQLKLDR